MALSVKEIAQVLTAKDGNISETAKALGVTRFAIQKRVSKSAELQEIVSDARGAMVDVAESELGKQVRSGNITAIIFTLKTQGKDRGYVERTEITGADGESLLIKVDQ